MTLMKTITLQIWSTSKLTNEEDLIELSNDIDNIDLDEKLANAARNLLDECVSGSILVTLKE